MLLLQISEKLIRSVHFELSSSYTISKTENIPLFKTKHNFVKCSFFLSVIMKWNSLDHNIKKVGSFGFFKNNILKFIRPTFNSASICEYYRGIKLIKRLRVDLVHLRKHRFKHSFQNKSNLRCSCGFKVKSTSLLFHVQ